MDGGDATRGREEVEVRAREELLCREAMKAWDRWVEAEREWRRAREYEAIWVDEMDEYPERYGWEEEGYW